MVNEEKAIMLIGKKNAGKMSAYRETVIESTAFDGTAKTKIIEYEPTHPAEVFFGEAVFVGNADANPNQDGCGIRIFVDDVLKFESLGAKYATLETPPNTINIEKPIVVEAGSVLKIVLFYETAPANTHTFRAVFRKFAFDTEANFSIDTVTGSVV